MGVGLSVVSGDSEGLVVGDGNGFVVPIECAKVVAAVLAGS